MLLSLVILASSKEPRLKQGRMRAREIGIQVIFSYGIQSIRGYRCHAPCVDVLLED